MALLPQCPDTPGLAPPPGLPRPHPRSLLPRTPPDYHGLPRTPSRLPGLTLSLVQIPDQTRLSPLSTVRTNVKEKWVTRIYEDLNR